MQSLNTITRGAIFFGLTLLIAIGGYVYAGWSWLDAIYMTTITVFGVGFGEVRPIADPRLRVFTIFVIIAGCSSAIYVIGGIVQMVAEGEFNRYLGARRMTKGIEQLSNHCVMCGYGRVGQHLARELKANHEAFVIVDTNTDRLREAEAEGFLVIVGDATEEETLRMAGVERARVVASVLSSDAENVFITLTAREMNPVVQIIARAESQSTEKKLLRSGATRVVLPTMIGAIKIANLVSRPSVESLLIDAAGRHHLNEELGQIGLNMSEYAIEAKSPLVGQTVADIEVSGVGGFVVVAIQRGNGELIRQPGPGFRLAINDTVMVLGHANQLSALGRRAASRGESLYRGARV